MESNCRLNSIFVQVALNLMLTLCIISSWSVKATDPAAEQYYVDFIDSSVQAKCILCHNVSGFVFKADDTAFNHAIFDGYVSNQAKAERLLAKIRGELAHGGGIQVPAGSAEYQNFQSYVQLLLSEAPVTSFTVSIATQGNGSVSPSSSQTVSQGDVLRISVSPSEGNELNNVGGSCGGSLSGSVYVTEPISQNCSVVAYFSPISFTITVVPSDGGTVLPANNQIVAPGTDSEFTVVANDGFKIAGSSGSCVGQLDGSRYLLLDVRADCTVEIIFEPQQEDICQNCTDSSLRKITEAYIGLLGRAPDLNGLAYWAKELDGLVASGANADVALKKLTSDITLSDEWRAGIGVNDGSTQAGAEAVVRAMYLNLFERSATPDDVKYWSPDLTFGRVTESQIVVLLIQGAQQKANADSGVLEYKRQAAAYYIEVVSSELFTRANAASVVDAVYDEQTLLDSKSMSDNLSLGG